MTRPVWVYKQTEFAGRLIAPLLDSETCYIADLWTVGYYDPRGGWHTDSDHDTPESAADRVAYLNGEGRGQ